MIVDPIVFTIDGMPGTISHWVNVLGNTYLYFANAWLAPFWIGFLLVHLRGRSEQYRKHVMILSPAPALLAVLAIVNIFYPIIFTVGEDNVFHRKPLALIYWAYMAVYIVCSIVLYRIHRRGSKTRFFPIGVFILPLVIGTSIQGVVYGVSLNWPSLAVAICGVLMSVEHEVAFVDQLTGVHNRAFMFATSFYKKMNGAVMLDVNDLKSINDNYGHSTGDEALTHVAEVIAAEASGNGFVVRYAGDEFILFSQNGDPAVLEQYSKNIQRALDRFNATGKKPYKLSVSYGIGVYDKHHESLDDLLCRIDANMYEAKRRYYSEHHDRRSSRSLLAYDVDVLTGLPRHHRFITHAQDYQKECFAKQVSPVYIYFDLSNFKLFNMNYGTKSGDQLLKDVARILQNEFTGGYVARFAEDHFMVLTAALNADRQTRHALDRINGLRADANVYCRVGVCRLEDTSLTPDEGINYAREACDSIPRESHIHIQEYSPELAQRLKNQAYVVDHIEEAIQKQEIQIYYQPVIRSASNTLCSFEALARWNSGTLGYLSPKDFIPALENAHQIHKLDCQIIRGICEQYQKTVQAGKTPVKVSFNLSRLDFQMCDMVQFVLDCTKEYQVPHDMLCVEITETTLASDNSLIQDAIARFHEEGFQVWMDDFGSGYSSLNTLKDYQFDKLKLDMAFLSVFTEKSQKIISSIVMMAQGIGIHTLAEGVETAEQAEFLRSIGCEEMQGYFFGKPLPMEDSLAQIEAKAIEVEEM